MEFQASISDIEQINPLFSRCKVRVLYAGKNRNMSIIEKETVERALPTLKNIPIVGEYSEEIKDFKGHGGKIDLDTLEYIHTTKPYGVVPESATYEWEEVNGKEYLTINDCYLWTGRYNEAYDVIKYGKGQSMEIEVLDGEWDDAEEAYRINNFIFSALCILGNDVEPAFEDASIVAYTLDKDSFKQEFSLMLKELKESLSGKEEDSVLEELLKKYSLTIEDLESKGIKADEISGEDLEAKIIELFEIDIKNSNDDDKANDTSDAGQSDDDSQVDNGNKDNPADEDTDKDGDVDNADDEGEKGGEDEEGQEEPQKEYEYELESRIKELQAELEKANSSLSKATATIATLTKEIEELREFKLNVEKKEHEAKAKELFNRFQLDDVDVEGIDIYKFTLEQLEEKCYAILGKKIAMKKNFSKSKDNGIHLPVGNDTKNNNEDKPYGGLIEKYVKNQ